LKGQRLALLIPPLKSRPVWDDEDFQLGSFDQISPND